MNKHLKELRKTLSSPGVGRYAMDRSLIVNILEDFERRLIALEKATHTEQY